MSSGIINNYCVRNSLLYDIRAIAVANENQEKIDLIINELFPGGVEEFRARVAEFRNQKGQE